MVIPPILAAKGAQSASKALIGDIYVRRWTSKPKKKGQAPVEHEVRVNAVTGAVVAVGAAATAVGGALALWMLQMRLAPTKESVSYGYWYWAFDGSHTAEIDERRRGEPPTKQQWIEGTGHWEDTGTGINKGPFGWSAGARIWITDTPGYYQTVTATWHQTRVTDGVKRFSIEERKGFGIGEILQTPTEVVGAGTKAPSIIVDIITNPFKYLKR